MSEIPSKSESVQTFPSPTVIKTVLISDHFADFETLNVKSNQSQE